MQKRQNMYGIILLPLVPMRFTAAENSEMVSQLLYGETIEVLEQQNNWLHICNLADNYTGWVDKKTIKIITQDQFDIICNTESYPISTPTLSCFIENNKQKILLPGGGIIRKKLYLDGVDELNLIQNDGKNETINSKSIVEIAKQYLNAPYLWGGKSIFGIDCSGLVQLVHSIAGISLPRDASQQVELGQTIDFLDEALEGDLAFFENKEGKITHVGILINKTQIIHASGWVKVERIDIHGIISNTTNEYSHKLRVIKRLNINI